MPRVGVGVLDVPFLTIHCFAPKQKACRIIGMFYANIFMFFGTMKFTAAGTSVKFTWSL